MPITSEPCFENPYRHLAPVQSQKAVRDPNSVLDRLPRNRQGADAAMILKLAELLGIEISMVSRSLENEHQNPSPFMSSWAAPMRVFLSENDFGAEDDNSLTFVRATAPHAWCLALLHEIGHAYIIAPPLIHVESASRGLRNGIRAEDETTLWSHQVLAQVFGPHSRKLRAHRTWDIMSGAVITTHTRKQIAEARPLTEKHVQIMWAERNRFLKSIKKTR